jgi:short-subunit dehydrogenase
MGSAMDLKNSVVIVTGASSGIGAALAKAFSAQGAKVTIVARRINRLKEVADTCPGEIHIVETDLTKKQDREKIVHQTMERWGRIDVLVNNAGLGSYGDFMASTEEHWRALFEINLFSPVFLTRAVMPIMLKQGRGVIVNVASIGGLMAHAEKVTPYVSSKHALIGFSRGLAKDMEGRGIRVLAVCPHLTATEFFSVSPGAEAMAPVVEKYRDFMDTPDEVALGIIENLDSDRLVVFPTSKPAKAYERQRDI